jgi:hypothetical protein
LAERQHIDEVFKEKLQNYQYQPSADLWNRIEAGIESSEPELTEETTPTNTPGRSYKTTVAGISFLLLFFSIYFRTAEDHFIASKYENAPSQTAYIAKPHKKITDDITSTQTGRTTNLASENEQKATLRLQANNLIAQTSGKQKNNQDTGTETVDGYDESNSYTTGKEVLDMYVMSQNNSTVRILKDIATTTKPIQINSTIPVTTDSAPIRTHAVSPVPEITSRYFNYENHTANIKQKYYDEVTNYSPQLNLKGFNIGVAGSYLQTSVLENGNIFKGDKPIQPALKFSTAKSITIGYNFNNRIGVQADYYYNTILGQNYVLSEDDKLVQKSLTLYYNQVPVTFKLKVPRISDFTQKPVVSNYIAGIQYGKLTEYHIPQEKLYAGQNDLFKAYDLSLLLGIDYDVFLGDRTYLTLGARTAISNNISTQQYPFDEYAKRNFTLGIRASLNYMFRDY